MTPVIHSSASDATDISLSDASVGKMPVDPSSMKVDELKQELSKRSLPTVRRLPFARLFRFKSSLTPGTTLAL
eukprot:scaffold301_cov243-Pinguiococcus_pyrenoidosus.AAC.84